VTEDEIRQKLKDLGMEPGKWSKRPETGPRVPKLLQEQADVIVRVRDEVLVPQTEKYKVQIQTLNEKIARLKHGGGR